MLKTKHYLMILGILFALLIGCEQPTETKPTYYSSFRAVPKVSPEEVQAIENLQQQRAKFVYGTIPGTETFIDASGEINGFTALFCNWLSGLIGVPIEIRFYEWNELLKGLETGEIDFTGELTAVEDSKTIYFMTEAIASRSLKYFRVKGSESIEKIAITNQANEIATAYEQEAKQGKLRNDNRRPLRFGFLTEAIAIKEVAEHFTDTYEPVYVANYEEAYQRLQNGTIDAFIDENTAEAAFNSKIDIITEDFFPLIYTPVSLSTLNPENIPVIQVVQKALQANAIKYLTEMYQLGEYEYKKSKLFSRFTEEELAFIRELDAVSYVAEHDNYPLSFYNAYDKEFQGIAHDILREITELTNLRFKMVNTRFDDSSDILNMLEKGVAKMITELVWTFETGDRFLRAKTAILTDYYALLSKTETPNIRLNDILYKKVALVSGYASTEVFNKWFPNHRYVVYFKNFNQAFKALEEGKVDLVMASQNQLLVQTNFNELAGYKANFVFNYPFDSVFGFNKDQAILRSIIDKTLQVIDTKGIADQWTRKTYDYRIKIVQARFPWLMGTIILLQLLIILLIVIAYRSHKEKQRLITLHKIVLEMTADLIEYRDSGTGGHTHRTSLYLKIFIEEIIKRGLYKKETALWNIDQLIMSAQLHDVGKIMIDDNILRKPSQLTDEEFAKMKEHTTLGADIIQKMQLKTTDMAFLNDAKMFALYHHEKWDGTGYPHGIKGEEIPLPARLMTIIDFYDALTSKRTYKEAFTHQQALDIITSGKGKQFDPELTDIFLSIADKFKQEML